MEEDENINEETPLKELPFYKSHKVVQAFKVLEITQKGDGKVLLIGAEYKALVDVEYFKRNNRLCVGCYYVKYENGYESWSPCEAFEEGYSRTETNII